MERILMILGGSQGHVQAIQRAQSLGLKVLVVDRNVQCVGARLADFFEPVDTTHVADVQKVAERYQIIGSLTLSSDIAVPTSCYVNEKLRLPVQGYGIREVVADKSRMKTCFANGGVRSPKFYKIENEDEWEAVRAVVEQEFSRTSFLVKPADSSGSRGVAKIQSFAEFDELVQEAKRFSRSGKVIVEEFVEGRKIGVETFSLDGEMVLCLIHNSTLSADMVNIGHSFPIYGLGDQGEAIRQECERGLRCLGIRNGPVNFDLILDAQETPWVLEINARLGGTKLPELVKAYCGIDLLELTIRTACGDRPVIPDPLDSCMGVAVRIFRLNDGIPIDFIFSSQRHPILEKYRVIEFHSDPVPHDLVPQAEGMSSRTRVCHSGYVICTGSNAWEAERNCDHFLQDVQKLILEGGSADETYV